jgi:predicted PurR-regulated permease PerM
MYFNIPAAAFLGLIGMVLACIPFLGVPIIWVPIAALEALAGNYEAALAIAGIGVLVFIAENVLRPLLQKGVGQIHPLISVIGAILGIVYFGILGVLIGPIVLSFAVLMARMFKEEYV